MSMKIADILNPSSSSRSSTVSDQRALGSYISSPSASVLHDSAVKNELFALSSPPLSPERYNHRHTYFADVAVGNANSAYGKPRNRFSEYEDAIICDGVAKGLTWGQISGKLPHRKRATCFNRYRTLQGIRKSRKRYPFSSLSAMLPPPIMMSTPPSSRRASVCSQQPFFTPSPSPPMTALSVVPPLPSSGPTIGDRFASKMHARTATMARIGDHYERMQSQPQQQQYAWVSQQPQQVHSIHRYAGHRGHH